MDTSSSHEPLYPLSIFPRDYNRGQSKLNFSNPFEKWAGLSAALSCYVRNPTSSLTNVIFFPTQRFKRVVLHSLLFVKYQFIKCNEYLPSPPKPVAPISCISWLWLMLPKRLCRPLSPGIKKLMTITGVCGGSSYLLYINIHI